MSSRRLIVFLYVVLLSLIGVGAGAFLIEARAEFDKLKKDQAAAEAQLAAARFKLAERQRILERLRSDPDFIAKVVRTQLGYGKPDEVIFRFDSVR